MNGLRRGLPVSVQSGHDRSGLAVEGMNDLAPMIGNGRRHQHFAFGEMPHQVQIKRQLREAEFFEQGEYEFAALRGEKKIAVFYA